MEKRVDS